MISNISGFPEFLPHYQIAFSAAIATLQHNFKLHGFIPMDTAAVELVETLLAKGIDHEIYGIHRLAAPSHNTDHDSTNPASPHLAVVSSKKELALRFDLTVPLARYVARNYGQLTFPYRRYHIAPVWRGERAQAGRYRQFYQCDIDIVGEGELENAYDAEVLSMAYGALHSLGLADFTINFNSRAVLVPLIRLCGVPAEAVEAVVRVLDKLGKITAEEVLAQIVAIAPGVDFDMIKLILESSGCGGAGSVVGIGGDAAANSASDRGDDVDRRNFSTKSCTSSNDKATKNVNEYNNSIISCINSDDKSSDDNNRYAGLFSYLRAYLQRLAQSDFEFESAKDGAAMCETVVMKKTTIAGINDSATADELQLNTVTHTLAADNLAQNMEAATAFFTSPSIAARRALYCELKAGLEALEEIIRQVVTIGIPEKYLRFDLSLARGLAYYSGLVFEIKSPLFPEIGTICAGGRYDNLASFFVQKKRFPGVGMSIGISRLLPKMIELGLLSAGKNTVAEVLIIGGEAKRSADLLSYQAEIAAELRLAGTAVEHYLGEKDLRWQMRYANRRGVAKVLIIRLEELQRKEVTLRYMDSGEQKVIDKTAVVTELCRK